MLVCFMRIVQNFIFIFPIFPIGMLRIVLLGSCMSMDPIQGFLQLLRSVVDSERAGVDVASLTVGDDRGLSAKRSMQKRSTTRSILITARSACVSG